MASCVISGAHQPALRSVHASGMKDALAGGVVGPTCGQVHLPRSVATDALPSDCHSRRVSSKLAKAKL
jgi:hypothetical protein